MIKELREPKKYVLKSKKRRGYWRKSKSGKKTWIPPGKSKRKVLSPAWIKWYEEEEKKKILAEYYRIRKEQIKRWRTGWLRAEFTDSKTGHKFYYKKVLTFKQFVDMRKREERIDSYKPIKFKRDRQSIRESIQLFGKTKERAEIAKWIESL